MKATTDSTSRASRNEVVTGPILLMGLAEQQLKYSLINFLGSHKEFYRKSPFLAHTVVYLKSDIEKLEQ